MSLNGTPTFSVVMPTRNRPGLFAEALQSVVAQDYDHFDIIVINDGSDDSFLSEYQSIVSGCGRDLRWIDQVQRPRGHGQSYSMNTGVYASTADYICFLDDDDTWSDDSYLRRLSEAIGSDDDAPDVIYSNQRAYDHHGRPVERKLWLADREQHLRASPERAGGGYKVERGFLLASGGFAHLNCTAIKRSLYLDLSGMDENIRYECDRDFYLRTLDRASSICHMPQIMARHNVPDPRRSDNMSTLVSKLEKYLYQVTVFEKALLFSHTRELQAAGFKGLAIVYRAICSELLSAGRPREARGYALKALGMRWSLKWWMYCQYLGLRTLFA